MSIKDNFQTIKSKMASWLHPEKGNLSEESPDDAHLKSIDDVLDSYEDNLDDDEKYFRADNEVDLYVPREDLGYHRNYLRISYFKLKVILLLGIIVVFALISIWFLIPGRIPYTKP